MEVKIQVETECPVQNQELELNVNLDNVECIGDLKKKLQPLLSVAACDMSVYYHRQVLGQKLENSEKISNLYVQDGDTFIVTFVSVCNSHFVSQFLENMKVFIRNVCDRFSDGKKIQENIEWSQERAEATYDCYQNLLASLEECCYEMFIPWNYRPTNANRRYFAQEGGVDLLAKVFNFASKKRYPLGDK